MPDFPNQIPLSSDPVEDRKQRFGARPQGRAFGLTPNGRRVTDGAATGTTFSSVTGGFKPDHVGRMIVVKGAGTAGAVHISFIAAVTNGNTVTMSNAAATPVTGAVAAWGTDNADAFDNAVTAIEVGGNALFIDGGIYLTSRTINLTGSFRLYGPCFRIDLPDLFDGQQQAGRHACIISTANPCISIAPYPGIKIENIHVHAIGTTQAINLWEVENYPYQVGFRLGNVGEPLVIPEDDYGAGGNGGIFLNGVVVSGASGWAFYNYKLWGQSEFNAIQIFECGTVPSGGDPTMHGGIWEAGECADLSYNLIHIIGVAAGYSGPLNMGCGIKRGGNGNNLDALNRFKIGPTHSKFSKVFIEGKGIHAVREYISFASTYVQCHFGGDWDDISVGETPTLSWTNSEVSFIGCSSFALPNVYIRSRRVLVDGWAAEGVTRPKFHYSYPGLRITGHNLELVPEQDDGIESDYPNRVWESQPVAFSDQKALPYNLLPNFQSDRWTFTMTPPASFVVNANLIRLAQGGQAEIQVDDLTPNAVYTLAFRHRVAFDAALEDSTFRIYETAGADIANLQVGSSDTAVAGTVTWILLQFKAPASGSIVFECANVNFNQTEWTPPFLGFGPHSEVFNAGYLIQHDLSTLTTTGTAIHQTGDKEVWGDILTRHGAADTTGAALLGRAPSNTVGVGLNVRWNGTDWAREGNGSFNGAAAVLGRLSDGAILLVPMQSTGIEGDTTTDVDLLAQLRAVVDSGGVDVLGAPGVENAVAVKKTGLLSGLSNVEFRLASRANGIDFALYAFDGATTWAILEAFTASQSVLINGIDIANLFPAGVSGRFLQSLGGSSKQWAKVDVGDATNVQFTGGTNNAPVQKHSSGALITGALDVANVNQVTHPYTAGVVLAADFGGQIGYYTLVALTGLLDESVLLTKINSALGYDLAAAIASLNAHTHDYDDWQADATTGDASPSDPHAHSISGADSPRTTATPNL